MITAGCGWSGGSVPTQVCRTAAFAASSLVLLPFLAISQATTTGSVCSSLTCSGRTSVFFQKCQLAVCVTRLYQLMLSLFISPECWSRCKRVWSFPHPSSSSIFQLAPSSNAGVNSLYGWLLKRRRAWCDFPFAIIHYSRFVDFLVHISVYCCWLSFFRLPPAFFFPSAKAPPCLMYYLLNDWHGIPYVMLYWFSSVDDEQGQGSLHSLSHLEQHPGEANRQQAVWRWRSCHSW